MAQQRAISGHSYQMNSDNFEISGQLGPLNSHLSSPIEEERTFTGPAVDSSKGI